MTEKPTEKTIKQMQRLYDKDVSIAEISRRTRLPYRIAREHTRLKELGFASLHEYYKHLVKKNGFKSISEYQQDLAKRNGFKSYAEYKANKLGFTSDYEYQQDLAKRRGFESYHEYKSNKLGFASLHEYLKDNAKKNGFASLHEYQKHLAKKKQKDPLSIKLSKILVERLDYLDKTQHWLADKIGISQVMISHYFTGKAIPKKATQSKLFLALKLPYKTLDDLM